MDYNMHIKVTLYNISLGILLLCFLTGCGGSNETAKSTFYIEFVNFDDSLGTYVTMHSTGKVAYYKDNKLQVLSQNYVTEKEPGMNLLEKFTGAETGLPDGSKKIRVEKIGLYPPDSVRYSLQKFVYQDGKWTKISDMGSLKAVTTFNRAKQFYVTELGKQLVTTIAEYSFQ